MTPDESKIDQARVMRELNYSPETGQFSWNTKRKGRNHKKVGGVSLGYIRIGIDGMRFFAHRVAWLYVHGEWPKGNIDHINRNKMDNRICNLRVVSQQENNHNQRTRRDSSTGHAGVSLHWTGKYRAYISVSGRQIHVGLYENFNEAVAARAEAKRKFHPTSPEEKR